MQGKAMEGKASDGMGREEMGREGIEREPSHMQAMGSEEGRDDIARLWVLFCANLFSRVCGCVC